MSARTYPRWIHHPQHGSVIVQSSEHEEALGPGWCDSPADFPSETTGTAPEEPQPLVFHEDAFVLIEPEVEGLGQPQESTRRGGRRAKP